MGSKSQVRKYSLEEMVARQPDVGWAVVVTGPTDYASLDPGVGTDLQSALKLFPPGSVLFNGDAEGADRVASTLAAALPMYRVLVPYYGPGGRAGGPMRNRLMVELASAWATMHDSPTVALACGSPGRSSGTDDCVRHLKQAGWVVCWVGSE